MTSQSKLAIAERLPTEAASGDDWVLSLSREEPGCVRWAERGPLRGFFRGLLFDREALAGSADRGQPDRSDADLVLRSYERGGEAALSRLRGSFVVAVIDRARDI